MEDVLHRLENKSQEVRIDAGELIGYALEGHEFIHQKGSPGWRNADTEMFPIIGPTNEAGFQVQVPRGSALLDQHGHLRELKYDCIDRSSIHAVYRKVYEAGTPVQNSKYPEKSSRQWLVWPYSFVFQKSFFLDEDGLRIEFVVDAEKEMPYMLGYHPAFKLHGPQVSVQTGEKEISLEEVLAVGSRALQIPKTNSVVLSDQRKLQIRTEGFQDFMLWTEVPNMICVEPITFYPYAVKQTDLHQGFQYSQGVQKFQVQIKPV